MERRGSGGDHEPFSEDKDPLSTGDALSDLAGGGGLCGRRGNRRRGCRNRSGGQRIDAEPGLARGGAKLLLPAVRGRKGWRRARLQPLKIMRILDRAGSPVADRPSFAKRRTVAEHLGITTKFRSAILEGRALPSWQATLRGRVRARWLVEPLCGVGRNARVTVRCRRGSRRWHGGKLTRASGPAFDNAAGPLLGIAPR